MYKWSLDFDDGVTLNLDPLSPPLDPNSAQVNAGTVAITEDIIGA